MVREKTCFGIGLIAFGVGILISLLLSSGICLFLLAGGCIAAGILLLR